MLRIVFLNYKKLHFSISLVQVLFKLTAVPRKAIHC